MNLNVAIVGAARMGRERARSAKALGAEISFIFDPDVKRRNALAVQYEARAVDTVDEVDMRKVDAVFVCTPPSSRASVELHAIRADVTVFVEKPIGLP